MPPPEKLHRKEKEPSPSVNKEVPVPRNLKKVKEEVKQKWDTYKGLSNDVLEKRTDELKKLFRTGRETTEDIKEAFAIVCEAAHRTLKMEPYDVQIMGALALYDGNVAEMQTGEGKTLVAALAASVKALSGDGVHMVTTNNYLAGRDAELMTPLYQFLGLDVGLTLPDTKPSDKKKAYQCAITYGTAEAFGFDYLRDQRQTDERRKIRRKDENPFYIIDEVDAILLDQGKTPWVLNPPPSIKENKEPLEQDEEIIRRAFAGFVETAITPDDYFYEPNTKNLGFTDSGNKKIAEFFGYDETGNSSPLEDDILHMFMEQALKAKVLFQKDTNYRVRDGKIVPYKEGREFPEQRFGEGMHTALEAKEELEFTYDAEQLAMISPRNYFNLFAKAGMTGSAKDVADELERTYGSHYTLDDLAHDRQHDPKHRRHEFHVVPIPPHLPNKRIDHADRIYLTKKEQLEALVEDIVERHSRGQPILVGTNGDTALEDSKIIAKMLDARGLSYRLLTADQTAEEAAIVAEAGTFGAITIATQMAGRGTDIKLGGDPETFIKKYIERSTRSVTDADIEILREWHEKTIKEEIIQLGGLCVLGVGNNESSRMDKQLRGRAGRQGDPGESRFYLSLDDMTLINGLPPETVERLRKQFERTAEGTRIRSRSLRRYFRRAQQNIESHAAAYRKATMEFDNMIEKQKAVILKDRQTIIESQTVEPYVHHLIEDLVAHMFKSATQDEPLSMTKAQGNQINENLRSTAELTEPNGEQITRATRKPKLPKLRQFDRLLKFDRLGKTIGDIFPLDDEFRSHYQRAKYAPTKENMSNLQQYITRRLISTYDQQRSAMRARFREQLKGRTISIESSTPIDTAKIDQDAIVAQIIEHQLNQWEKATIAGTIDRILQKHLASVVELGPLFMSMASPMAGTNLPSATSTYSHESRLKFAAMQVDLQKEIVKALLS